MTTTIDDLEGVRLPHGKRLFVYLHPAAAAGFRAALTDPTLDDDDRRALCRINSDFRPAERQQALVDRYTAIVGGTWVAWRKLTDEQRSAARRAGFAYHPGKPVDAPHTHVGGGALDIDSGITPRAAAAMERAGFKRDTPGDLVHWGWHPVR